LTCGFDFGFIGSPWFYFGVPKLASELREQAPALQMKIKTALREGGLFWIDLYVCQRTFAFTIPSSKQKILTFSKKKQASDDVYAATQILGTYWAVFCHSQEICQ